MGSSIRKETGLLAKHYSVYGLTNMLSRLVGFLMIPVYTSYITPANYGVMELIEITISLIQTVVAFGMASGLGRFYFETDDPEKRKEVVSSAFFGLGGLVILAIGLLSLGSNLMSRLVLGSSEYTRYFYIAFATLGVGVLTDLHVNYFRIEKKSIAVSIVSLIQLIGTLGLNIYFLVSLKMGIWGIFVSNFIMAVVVFCILTPVVLRKIGVRISKHVIHELLRFGLPLIPSNIASYIVAASDRYFIRKYVSLSETGIYSLGYKFGTLITSFVTQPFNQIWGPRRLEMFGKDDWDQAYGRIFTYYTFVLFFGGLLISVLSRDIVHIMADRSYWSAAKLIPIITLAHVVFSFYYHFNVGIIIEKKTKYFAYINLMNAILNVGLNIMIIKPLGVWGAALSTLACYVFRTALCYYYSNKFHKIYVEWKRIGLMFFFGAVYYFSIGRLHIGNAIVDVCVKSLITMTYPLMLYIFRFFDPEEVKEIRTLVRKGRIWIFGKFARGAADGD